MRLLHPAAAILLLAGCATRPPPRTAVRHPGQVHAPATATAKSVPTAAPTVTAEPVAATQAVPAPSPTPSAPPAAIPMMGFRPMRGQTGAGA